MAMSRLTSTASQLERSYRGWIRDCGYPDKDIPVVINGTLILLRRHCTQGTICCHCANDDPDQCKVTGVDKLGFITELQCLVCSKHLSAVCRTSKYYFERIKDPSVLERGDHVGWYRPLAYWHHAIVTRQSAYRVAVIGYSVRNRDSPCARIREKEYKHRHMSSLLRGSLYRIQHDDCYTNEYTALRAERTVGEEKYDFFEQNCEHSTTWSKTGLHSSDQLESCFMSIGKLALAVFLRAVMLAVLWLLQICHLTQVSSDSAEQRWVERAVNIAYVSLIAGIFATFSIYKACSKVKSSVEPSYREPHDDAMEACRKNFTNKVFRCCCGSHPACSRLTCSVCFVACICCSLCQASWSLCARKLRKCRVPCCGRSVGAVVRLVVRILARELIAASGPFLVVWFTDDILSQFQQSVVVSVNPAVNRVVVVVVAIIVASVVTYPLGVLLSRWLEGLIECCYCCPPRSRSSLKPPPPSCPVHDQVISIPASCDKHYCLSDNQQPTHCSAVIALYS